MSSRSVGVTGCGRTTRKPWACQKDTGRKTIDESLLPSAYGTPGLAKVPSTSIMPTCRLASCAAALRTRSFATPCPRTSWQIETAMMTAASWLKASAELPPSPGNGTCGTNSAGAKLR